MSPKGGYDGVSLDPPTEAEARQIREAYDTVLIRQTRSGQGRYLHIPNPDHDNDHHEHRPLCGGKQTTTYIPKGMAVYPPGYHDFCTECVAEWRKMQD